MNRNHIKYNEGQWFAIPLRTSGYGLGIIVRGSYKTKGGLGYFFGPKYGNLPGEETTCQKDSREAVLIAKFGDLGIITGRWPLIQSSSPFSREEWPVPKFGIAASLMPNKGIIREYDLNDFRHQRLISEIVVDIKEIVGLPEDVEMGGGAIEIRLTKLLEGG
jgi:hypothetical protein